MSDKRIAILLFLAAFLARLTYVIIYFFTNPIPPHNLYYDLAQEILSQGRIFYDTSDPYYEFPGPVIPWLNALTMLVFGKNYLGLYIITAAGSALVTCYTYMTARLLLDKIPSLLVGIWSLFYLFYFLYSPSPGKDIWMSFMMIFLVYTFIKLFILDYYSLVRYLLFILMFTISFHLDERFFIFTPFLAFLILYYDTGHFTKFKVSKTILFITLIIILMVPWTIRNYNKHGKIVLLSTRTEAFTDPILGYESRGHMMDDYNDIQGVFYIHDYQIDSIIKGQKTQTDGGWDINEAQRSAMENGILPSPLTGFRAFFSRLQTMFEPIQIKGRFERTGYFFYKKSLRHNLATFIFYGLLLIFSVPGYIYMYRINKPITRLILAIIIIYALIHALFIPYTNWRYRLPLDALFIISGWIGAWRLYLFLIRNKLKHIVE